MIANFPTKSDNLARESLADKLERNKHFAQKARDRERNTKKPGLLLAGMIGSAAVFDVPMWANAARAMPNVVVRSALFAAIQPGAREFHKNKLVASLGGVEVYSTGEQLDQGDLDVWLTVHHLARGSSRLRTTAYQILQVQGYKDSGKHRQVLEARLLRLVQNTIEIKEGAKMYCGGLLTGVARDQSTGEWVVDFNPSITQLLYGEQFTLVQWSARSVMAGHPLAQWLHAFYSSHSEPFPMKVETLHALSGSKAKVIADFAKMLRKALAMVKQVMELVGEKFDYEVHRGLVKVRKSKPNLDQEPIFS